MKFRLVFSQFFGIRGYLGNAKEKPPVHWLKKSDYFSLVEILHNDWVIWINKVGNSGYFEKTPN